MSEAVEKIRGPLIELLPRLRRFARNLTRQPDDADDLVQIALERALMRCEQWDSNARLDSWMFGMASITRRNDFVNAPNEIDDATLMAYADGELNAAQSAHIEQLLKRDSIAAARVAQYKALRSQLQAGLSAVLSEPVPERLYNVMKAHASKAQDNVVDLSQARRKRSMIDRWTNREWSAIAASLIVGIVLGMYALKFNASQ